MLLEDIDRKTWEKYEKIQICHDRHPLRYKLKLAFLLLQFVIMTVVVIGGLIYLFGLFLFSPKTHLQLLGLLAINTVISLWSYVCCLRAKPWQEMEYLPPEEYPKLYRKVNWIAKIMKAPKIHRIYIHDELNACVDAVFPLIPGLRRNVLMLGYPLLCVLSSKALLATLAHEFGHISRRHLSINAIFCRIEVFWPSMKLGIFSWVLNPWIRYFQKALAVALHPIRYQEEREADQYIAEHLGVEYELEGLTQIHVQGWFWGHDRQIIKLILGRDPETLDFAALIRDHLNRNHSLDESRTTLAAALQSIPPVFDEHPPFADRVGRRSVDELLPYAITKPDALTKLIGDHPAFYAAATRCCRQQFLPEAQYLTELGQTMQECLDQFSPDTATGETAWHDYLQALDFFDRQTEYDQNLAEACRRYPDSLSLRAIQLLRSLGGANDDERQAIIAGMENLLTVQPLLIYELNDQLFEYYLQHGLNDKIKTLLDLRDRAVRTSQKQTQKPPGRTDDIRPTPFSASEIEKMKELFAENAADIEAVYFFERHYDAATQVRSKFILIKRRCRIIQFAGDRELLATYDFPDCILKMADDADLVLMRDKNIAPIVISKNPVAKN